ncbi:MAG: hypothetical protein RJAPGHWK_002498, partial [Candidatus Fervidibacter sp.]
MDDETGAEDGSERAKGRGTEGEEEDGDGWEAGGKAKRASEAGWLDKNEGTEGAEFALEEEAPFGTSLKGRSLVGLTVRSATSL